MEGILQNLNTSIGITDAIDIFIVAFLIYKILQFIRETRAEQLAKGVLLFILVTIAAKWCHLYTLNWILQSLMTVGLLALVVIFQPELRRALEYIGRRKLSDISVEVSREEGLHIIGELVLAITTMSDERTGALIVFERETTLTDIVETGTVIDAKIDSQIIENIFYEGAPLHDGAMIIRGTRLHAAGCVLPLTENKGLAKKLGTRHRAGIGISENSDALVVIVSEETGTISIAENGKLRRGYNAEKLKEEFEKIYIKEYEKSFFGKIFSPKNAAEKKQSPKGGAEE